MMEQLSKAKIKLFGSLLLKKYREREGLFLTEGIKMAREAISSGFEVEAIIMNEKGSQSFAAELEPYMNGACYLTEDETFRRFTEQPGPEGVIAVVRLPAYAQNEDVNPTTLLPAGPAFLLDNLRDPGNLGTLIRTADWFGFKAVVCSPNSADCWNPRVLRASMGSIFRVPVLYFDNFETWVKENASHIWAADMAGDPLPSLQLDKRPYILLGSESNGLSEGMMAYEGIKRVAIPAYGKAESLNAAMAGAILAFAWQTGKS